MVLGMMLSTVSCGKYEGPDLNNETPSSLVFTSWINSISDSVDIPQDEGTVRVDITQNIVLLFSTERYGLLYSELVSRLAPDLNWDTTADFIYTYEMPQGDLTYEEQVDSTHFAPRNITFHVDKKQLMAHLSDGSMMMFDRKLN
jgi:hypothetical protein